MTGTTTCVGGWDQTKDGDSEGNDSRLEVQAFRVKTLPDRLGEIQLTVGAEDRPGKGGERKERGKQAAAELFQLTVPVRMASKN